MGLSSLFGISKEKIGRLEQKGDVDGLLKALRSKVKPDIRLETIAALGRLGTPEARSSLLNYCIDAGYSSSDVPELNSALALLRTLDGLALKEIFDAVFSERVYRRKQAIETLGKVATPAATSLLIPVCKGSEKDLRNAALDALISCDASRAIPVLLEGIGDAKYSVWDTLCSLGEISKTYSETFVEARDEICSALVPLLRSTEGQSIRTKAASLLDTLRYSPEALEDKLLFAIARNDVKGLRSEMTSAVPMAEQLHTAGTITNGELDRVYLAFPSEKQVEQLCRERKYSLLGEILRNNTQFNDQIYAHAVRPLMDEFIASEYADKRVAESLLSIGYATAADVLRIALDRGIYETDSDLQRKVSSFVADNKSVCGHPEEFTCQVCRRKKLAREMSFYTSDAPPNSGRKYQWYWFCKGRCWLERGKIIGSRKGAGCPFWENGVCKTSDRNYPCSLEVSSYTACYVYRDQR
jgi:hypothetical protein